MDTAAINKTYAGSADTEAVLAATSHRFECP